LIPKSEDEEILLEKAPKITKFLKKDSKKHYTSLKEYLDILEVPYTEKTNLI
jgi:histidyl-tRNA synthetase